MLSNFLAVEPCPTLPDTQLQQSTRYLTSLCLISASFMASFLVLLSGDLSLNPGPTGNFYDTAELPKLHGLKIAQLNVRSILNKMDNVRSLIHNKRFDIFRIFDGEI